MPPLLYEAADLTWLILNMGVVFKEHSSNDNIALQDQASVFMVLLPLLSLVKEYVYIKQHSSLIYVS